MRALVLISGLTTAGAEKVTVNFLRRLASSGNQANVCTVTNRHDGPLAAELEASGIVRRDLKARRLADPRALARLLNLMKHGQFDIIHAHGQDAAILAAAARFLYTTPLVITRHVLDEPQENWRQACRARLALMAFRRADSVVSVSEATADHLAELAGLSRAKIRVIPNGVDLESFYASDLSIRGAKLRKNLGIGQEDSVILLPAALRNGKGHDVLLAAIPHLQHKIQSLRIVIAGSGDREFYLRERAKSFGNSVIFVGNYNEMPVLFNFCDLVVLPSDSEALPTVLIEAAAAGRPVVATRVGGISEVVKENCTGLLIKPNDPEALANAITEMICDSDRLRAWGAAARSHADANFSIDLQLERTLELWTETIDRGEK